MLNRIISSILVVAFFFTSIIIPEDARASANDAALAVYSLAKIVSESEKELQALKDVLPGRRPKKDELMEIFGGRAEYYKNAWVSKTVELLAAKWVKKVSEENGRVTLADAERNLTDYITDYCRKNGINNRRTDMLVKAIRAEFAKRSGGRTGTALREVLASKALSAEVVLALGIEELKTAIGDDARLYERARDALIRELERPVRVLLNVYEQRLTGDEERVKVHARAAFYLGELAAGRKDTVARDALARAPIVYVESKEAQDTLGEIREGTPLQFESSMGVDTEPLHAYVKALRKIDIGERPYAGTYGGLIATEARASTSGAIQPPSGKIKLAEYDTIGGMGEAIAMRILDAIREANMHNRRLVLGLTFSESLKPMYEYLFQLTKGQRINWLNVVVFDVSEERFVAPNGKLIGSSKLDTYLAVNLERYGLRWENIHSFGDMANEPEKRLVAYRQEIEDAGGIDIEVLEIDSTGGYGMFGPAAVIDRDFYRALFKGALNEEQRRQIGYLNYFVVTAEGLSLTEQETLIEAVIREKAAQMKTLDRDQALVSRLESIPMRRDRAKEILAATGLKMLEEQTLHFYMDGFDRKALQPFMANLRGYRGRVELAERAAFFAANPRVTDLSLPAMMDMGRALASPRKGLSIGGGSLERARQILLVAATKETAGILKETLSSTERTEAAPLRNLQSHNNVTIMAMMDAARLVPDAVKEKAGKRTAQTVAKAVADFLRPISSGDIKPDDLLGNIESFGHWNAQPASFGSEGEAAHIFNGARSAIEKKFRKGLVYNPLGFLPRRMNMDILRMVIARIESEYDIEEPGQDRLTALTACVDSRITDQADRSAVARATLGVTGANRLNIGELKELVGYRSKKACDRYLPKTHIESGKFFRLYAYFAVGGLLLIGIITFLPSLYTYTDRILPYLLTVFVSGIGLGGFFGIYITGVNYNQGSSRVAAAIRSGEFRSNIANYIASAVARDILAYPNTRQVVTDDLLAQVKGIPANLQLSATSIVKYNPEVWPAVHLALQDVDMGGVIENLGTSAELVPAFITITNYSQPHRPWLIYVIRKKSKDGRPTRYSVEIEKEFDLSRRVIGETEFISEIPDIMSEALDELRAREEFQVSLSLKRAGIENIAEAIRPAISYVWQIPGIEARNPLLIPETGGTSARVLIQNHTSPYEPIILEIGSKPSDEGREYYIERITKDGLKTLAEGQRVNYRRALRGVRWEIMFSEAFRYVTIADLASLVDIENLAPLSIPSPFRPAPTPEPEPEDMAGDLKPAIDAMREVATTAGFNIESISAYGDVAAVLDIKGLKELGSARFVIGRMPEAVLYKKSEEVRSATPGKVFYYVEVVVGTSTYTAIARDASRLPEVVKDVISNITSSAVHMVGPAEGQQREDESERRASTSGQEPKRLTKFDDELQIALSQYVDIRLHGLPGGNVIPIYLKAALSSNSAKYAGRVTFKQLAGFVEFYSRNACARFLPRGILRFLAEPMSTQSKLLAALNSREFEEQLDTYIEFENEVEGWFKPEYLREGFSIGVPKEIKENEKRVGLTPMGVWLLKRKGVAKLKLERGAGVLAGFSDGEYKAAGATLVKTAKEAWGANLIIKVKEPLQPEYPYLSPDQTVFTYFHASADRELTRAMRASHATGVAYETIVVETADGKTLPLLAPMSEVAGRLAAYWAAFYMTRIGDLIRRKAPAAQLQAAIARITPEELSAALASIPSFYGKPIPETFAGRLGGYNATVMGGGTVGFFAADRLAAQGASVAVTEKKAERRAYLERVLVGLHRGAKVLDSEYKTGVDASLVDSDIVVTSVLEEGRRAPVLIRESDLPKITAKKGKLIIDVAIDQEGNVENAVATDYRNPVRVLGDGIVYLGVPNLPSAVPHEASIALQRPKLKYALALACGLDRAMKDIYPELVGGVNFRSGNITHPGVAEAFGLKAVSPVRASTSGANPQYLVIEGGSVVTPKGIIKEGVILIKDGVIEKVGTRSEVIIPVGSSVTHINAAGQIVIPGFIDLHVHGAFGATTLEASADVAEIIRKLVTMGTGLYQTGVTLFSPTICSAPLANIRACSYAALQAREIARNIWRIHSEGPAITRGRARGAQPLEHIFKPDDVGRILEVVPESGEGPGILTLAPEVLIREGLFRVLDKILERGTYISIGHMEPTEEEIKTTMAWARHLELPLMGTHLWNGTNRKENPELVRAFLAGNGAATFVGDGIHILWGEPDTDNWLFGLGHILETDIPAAAITDSLHVGGKEAYIAGIKYVLDNAEDVDPTGRRGKGQAYFAEDAARTLGGSAASMVTVFSNLYDWGVGIDKIVNMTSETPAMLIGEKTKGKIAAGYEADLAFVDMATRRVTRTIKGGETVYPASVRTSVPRPEQEGQEPRDGIREQSRDSTSGRAESKYKLIYPTDSGRPKVTDKKTGAEIMIPELENVYEPKNWDFYGSYLGVIDGVGRPYAFDIDAKKRIALEGYVPTPATGVGFTPTRILVYAIINHITVYDYEGNNLGTLGPDITDSQAANINNTHAGFLRDHINNFTLWSFDTCRPVEGFDGIEVHSFSSGGPYLALERESGLLTAYDLSSGTPQEIMSGIPVKTYSSSWFYYHKIENGRYLVTYGSDYKENGRYDLAARKVIKGTATITAASPEQSRDSTSGQEMPSRIKTLTDIMQRKIGKARAEAIAVEMLRVADRYNGVKPVVLGGFARGYSDKINSRKDSLIAVDITVPAAAILFTSLMSLTNNALLTGWFGLLGVIGSLVYFTIFRPSYYRDYLSIDSMVQGIEKDLAGYLKLNGAVLKQTEQTEETSRTSTSGEREVIPGSNIYQSEEGLPLLEVALRSDKWTFLDTTEERARRELMEGRGILAKLDNGFVWVSSEATKRDYAYGDTITREGDIIRWKGRTYYLGDTAVKMLLSSGQSRVELFSSTSLRWHRTMGADEAADIIRDQPLDAAQFGLLIPDEDIMTGSDDEYPVIMTISKGRMALAILPHVIPMEDGTYEVRLVKSEQGGAMFWPVNVGEVVVSERASTSGEQNIYRPLLSALKQAIPQSDKVSHTSTSVTIAQGNERIDVSLDRAGLRLRYDWRDYTLTEEGTDVYTEVVYGPNRTTLYRLAVPKEEVDGEHQLTYVGPNPLIALGIDEGRFLRCSIMTPEFMEWWEAQEGRNEWDLSAPFIGEEDARHVKGLQIVKPAEYHRASTSGTVGNPFLINMRARQQRTADILNLTPEQREALLNPENIYTSSLSVRLDGTTEDIYTVRVRDSRDMVQEIGGEVMEVPSKGGIRDILVKNLGEPEEKEGQEKSEFYKKLDEWNAAGLSLEEIKERVKRWVEEETMALGAGMTSKVHLVGLPLGGGKGTVTLFKVVMENGRAVVKDIVAEGDDYETKIAIITRTVSRDWAEHGIVGPDLDVPAPDVNTTPSIMAWFVDELIEVMLENRESYLWKELPVLAEILMNTPTTTVEVNYLKRAVVYLRDHPDKVFPWIGTYTGKDETLGGSLVRGEATALGTRIVAELMAEKVFGTRSLEGRTVAIEGFGNAGQNTARLFDRQGSRVLAVSDSKGGLYKESAFKTEELEKLYRLKARARKEGKSLVDLDYAREGIEGVRIISNEELLELDVDILVPAALENVITTANADRIRAKIILEAANGPVTIGADEILHRKGIKVVSDSLASAGGVIVSYYEMLQNFTNRYWAEEEIVTKLKAALTDNFNILWQIHEKFDVDLRTAGDILSVSRRFGIDWTKAIPARASTSGNDERIGFPLYRGATPEDIGVFVIGDGGHIRTELIGSIIGRLNGEGKYTRKVAVMQPRSTNSAEFLQGQEGVYETVTGYRDGTTETNMVDSVVSVGSLNATATNLSLREGETAREAAMRYAGLNLDLIAISVTETGFKGEKNSQVVKDLTEFLYRYFKSHGPSSRISIINTDNISDNGTKIKDWVLGATQTNDEWNNWKFLNWLKGKATFHNTMVDRIVSSPDRKEDVTKSPIAEPAPAIRMVIEDLEGVLPIDFGSVPGVIICRKPGEMERYHAWKLRILNALHTAQVYVAALSGLEIVPESIANPYIRGYIERLAAEITPVIDRTLPMEGRSAAQFAAESIDRFTNPYVPHRTREIAKGAVGKIGLRFAQTIVDEKGEVSPEMAFAVAAIFRYLTPVRKTGEKYIGRNDAGTESAEYEFEEAANVVPDNLLGMFGKGRAEITAKVKEILGNAGLWGGRNLAAYEVFANNVADIYYRMVSGEPAMQVIATVPVMYAKTGPVYQAERIVRGEEYYIETIEEPEAWQGPGSELFNDVRKRGALPVGNRETNHLFTIGEIPYFDRANYPDDKSDEDAVNLVLQPISPQILRQHNINPQTQPWLDNMCISCVDVFRREFARRSDVEFMAELRTRQNNHSCLLIKFIGDSKLYIFDRTAAQFRDLPEHLLLGWYAPLYDGTNAAECPEFEKYRVIYEAYMPGNFVLNTQTIWTRQPQAEGRTSTSGERLGEGDIASLITQAARSNARLESGEERLRDLWSNKGLQFELISAAEEPASLMSVDDAVRILEEGGAFLVAPQSVTPQYVLIFTVAALTERADQLGPLVDISRSSTSGIPFRPYNPDRFFTEDGNPEFLGLLEELGITGKEEEVRTAIRDLGGLLKYLFAPPGNVHLFLIAINDQSFAVAVPNLLERFEAVRGIVIAMLNDRQKGILRAEDFEYRAIKRTFEGYRDRMDVISNAVNLSRITSAEKFAELVTSLYESDVSEGRTSTPRPEGLGTEPDQQTRGSTSGARPERESEIAPQVAATISEVGNLTKEVSTHLVLRPEGAIDLSGIAVVMKKDLAGAITGKKGAIIGETLAGEYRVMKQGLRKLFSDGEGLFEAETQEELLARVASLRARGTKVIVLDDGTLSAGLKPEDIAGKAGEDWCVINAGIAENLDDLDVQFVNLNAMAVMGLGILYNDTMLFNKGYKAFTGADASENIISNLISRTLWIIKALPRIVRFTNELRDRESIRKLFAAAA